VEAIIIGARLKTRRLIGEWRILIEKVQDATLQRHPRESGIRHAEFIDRVKPDLV
jgi:hypothetical protein